MIGTYEVFEQAVISEIDPDFHDDNIDWIYNDDQSMVSDEVESLLRLMFLMGISVEQANIHLEAFRNDFLDRNYDGPADGEAWSGGFAENH